MTRKKGLFDAKAVETKGVKKNPRKAAKVEEVAVDETVTKIKKPVKSAAKVAPKKAEAKTTAKVKAKPKAKKAKAVEESPEQTLQVVIPRYYENNENAKSFKKIADADNKVIKTMMERGEFEEFEVGDIVANLTERTSTGYVEDLLLAKIKELGVPGIIKTVEVVDREALESAIAHGEIDMEDLVDTQKTTTSTALYVKLKK